MPGSTRPASTPAAGGPTGPRGSRATPASSLPHRRRWATADTKPSNPHRAATSNRRPDPLPLHPLLSGDTDMTTDIVIVAAARTAVGKFGGTLAKTPAPEL